MPATSPQSGTETTGRFTAGGPQLLSRPVVLSFIPSSAGTDSLTPVSVLVPGWHSSNLVYCISNEINVSKRVLLPAVCWSDSSKFKSLAGSLADGLALQK